MSISSDVLSVSTSDETFVGSYTITLTVTLADYATIAAVVKTINVVVTCTAQTVTFITPLIPALTTVQVGITT